MHAMQKIFSAFRSYRQGPRERGAVLVEAAIAIPMLLMVILGSVEFGFGWDAKSANTAAVRNGLLRAASSGDQAGTDLQILQAIIGEIGGDNADRIREVIIFEINGTDHSATANSCTNRCVSYDGAVIDGVVDGTVTTANFDGGGGEQATTPPTYNCDTGRLDTGDFCAGARTVAGDVELGIAIRYDHEWVTGILPFSEPVFFDIATSSTFLDEGAEISPSSINIPSSLGQVYESDFSAGPSGFTTVSGATPSTGSLDIDGTSSDPDTLGAFGTNTISKSVDSLAPHTHICVQATLWVIGSWDTGGQHGPDTFNLSIDGVDHPNYTDVTYHQNDKNTTLEGSHPGGFDYAQKVNIDECIPHTADAATIDFSAFFKHFGALATSEINDESWALSDVTISVNNN